MIASSTTGSPNWSVRCQSARTPPRKLAALRVHFLRHGESASNADLDLLALPPERGDRLTERGRDQARAAARHLSGIGASRIVTSPMRRARETAELLSEQLGLLVIELAELHELRECDDYGELSLEEQRLRRWSVRMSEHADDPDHSIRGGESFNDVLGRVRRAPDCLVEHADGSGLAVTHGIFLRFFLARSLLGDQFRPADAPRLWELGTVNCGLCVFEHLEGEPSAVATDPWTGPWRCLSWMELPRERP